MYLEWNPFGAFGILAMLLACALAVLIFLTSPSRLQNRLVALAISLGGLSAGFYFGLASSASDPISASQAIDLGILLLIPLPAVYLVFLSTIRTSVVRPLQKRWVQNLLIVYTVGVVALRIAWPEGFAGRVEYYPTVSAWHLDPSSPMPATRLLVLGPLAFAQLFGLLVAFRAYREATSSGARKQAQAFAVAFGIRDLLQVVFIVCFAVLPGSTWKVGQILFVLMIPAVDLLFYGLLGYGILKAQLFDIDLRIKSFVAHSVIAAVLAGTFLVVSEGLESLLPVESFWLGVAASGVIALTLRPLQRGAMWFADSLFPGVGHTPEYLGARKLEVYLHALEASFEDGEISERERYILHRLRQDLELTDEQIAEIEARVLNRAAVATG